MRNKYCLLLLPLLIQCVEPFEVQDFSSEEVWVVEGTITDDPGPYTVLVSRSTELTEDTVTSTPVSGLKIELFDILGNHEEMTETEPGKYMTSGIIYGRVDNSYFIRIETPKGEVFESIPEKLNSVGEIEDIRFEYESRTVPDAFLGEIPADVFNIYFDANQPESSQYVRWRYKGTYEVLTNPELNTRILQGNGLGVVYFPDPLPCSGYVQVNVGTISTIQKVDECVCCTCWGQEFEDAPLLSDGRSVTNGDYRNIKAAEVPINSATFFNKFLIEIEQMSLTKNAFDFFDLVRQQVEAADDLFQPNPAEITGNIRPITSSQTTVVGLFWATSITKEFIFIDRNDVPYQLGPIDPSTRSCLDVYPNSTNIRPELWED